MSDLFDTSQIPDESEHWDALAERVAASAARRSRPSGLHWIAESRASWVAASLLLAALLAFVLLPLDRSSSSSLSQEWPQALAPTDDVGRVLVLRDRPPAVGALLLGSQAGSPR